MYAAYYNLLSVQDLWQIHYKILSIILMKEFKELNINTDKIIKTVNHVEVDTEIVSIFLKTKTFKMI